MDIFTVGIIVLFIMTAIFYVVIFSFMYYWYLNPLTYIILPVVFTFEFFVVSFLVVSLTAIFLKCLPLFIKFLFL